MLRVLNCIPERSVASAIYPPRASISLVRCDFPMPPIAGLHDILPVLVLSRVTKATSSPDLFATSAASTPACPPPITIKSNIYFIFLLLLLLRASLFVNKLKLYSF